MMLQNSNLIPPAAVAALEKHVAILLRSLPQKLVGVYLHGSAAMGGFTPEYSDIDYITVINESLTSVERNQLADAFVEIYGFGAPAKGIEMSIVLREFTGSGFRYPTPYEFHMGPVEQIEVHRRPHLTEMLDADLAAHFTIIQRRGLSIFGEPINEVFAEVPEKYYLASIALDAEQSYVNIRQKTGDSECRVPAYAVLNFCRVLAFIRNGAITSKIEGGEWGLRELPHGYASVISAALDEYRNVGSLRSVEGQLLKEFAEHSMEIITAAVNSRRG